MCQNLRKAQALKLKLGLMTGNEKSRVCMRLLEGKSSELFKKLKKKNGLEF